MNEETKTALLSLVKELDTAGTNDIKQLAKVMGNQYPTMNKFLREYIKMYRE